MTERAIDSERGATPRPAWWQRGGGEECPYCLRLYVYEMEYRCEACDRPVCPCCVHVRSVEIVLCPECED